MCLIITDKGECNGCLEGNGGRALFCSTSLLSSGNLESVFFLSIITMYLCIPTLTGRGSFSWLISITSKRFLQEDRSKWWSNPSYTETLLARLVVDWLLVTACLLEPSYLRFQFRQVISSFKEKKNWNETKKPQRSHFSCLSSSSCNIPSWFSHCWLQKEIAAGVYLWVRQLILLWMNRVLWQNSGTAVITAVTH